MLRAALKGALLFAFGRLPGGASFYRELTRNTMGTQATHVDKLRRVWPGYVRVWTDKDRVPELSDVSRCPGKSDGAANAHCELTMEGLDIWVHESGWTPYPLLANFLTTGKGGVVTNTEARILDRYLARAVNGALDTDFPCCVPALRRQRVEPLRWERDAAQAIAAIGGRSVPMQEPGSVPLESSSVDLCHSGGALEHYRPEALAQFFAECFRVLRPGGIASHVLDHRDHLHHADKGRDFLAHLALPDPIYEFAYGHPLTYHNRLLPGQIMRMLEDAGFERIAVRRMLLPSRQYVSDEDTSEGQLGIPRTRLARRFREASDSDLRTAAAHYLYRKPPASW